MSSWWPFGGRRRRARLRSEPLTDEQRAVIAREVPLAAQLSAAERGVLEGHVQVFLDDKTFEGCGGLEMTDTIRLTVAAHACLLLVGLEVDRLYPGLHVIRVYPHTFRVPVTSWNQGVVTEGGSHRLGESSRHGFVVLSWDAVQRGARVVDDGQNVVLHEFAHQLDTEDGAADGAPVLPDPGLVRPWARVLGASYAHLQADVEAHHRSVLDAYGATNPAEFFAVATETFFEEGQRLKREEPELYDVMRRYYGQDPAGG